MTLRGSAGSARRYRTRRTSGIRSISKVCVLAVALAAISLSPASAGRQLDEGKLDTAWFGDDREFRKADEIDYLWVKPGFSLSGKKVQFAAWNEPQFMGEKAGERDAKDKRLAKMLPSTKGLL